MEDFQNLTDVCKENRRLAGTVVDNFLLEYSDFQDRTARDMDRRLKAFAEVAKEIPEEYVNMLRAQYMAHRIFRKNGLLKKYLNHRDLKELPAEERTYLEKQLANPWRFSFAIIQNQPADDFFEMWDVFSDQNYLLYSPGMATTLKERSPILWLNLIAFNGHCWETYGPIIGYEGFTPDDVFFFATELRPGKNFETDEEIYEDMETDPVPYMMLMTGATYPLTFNGDDAILNLVAEYETGSFDPYQLKETFEVVESDGVFRLLPGEAEEGFPFSAAYYDEDQGMILLYSMTDSGFETLVDSLNRTGFDFSKEADIRLTMAMMTTAGKILGRTIELNPYEELFAGDVDEDEEEESELLERTNHFLSLVIEDLNEGREPNVGESAAQAGIEIDAAQEIYNDVVEKINRAGKGNGGNT
ncbi:MAG: hypothetical protein R6U46_11875 [Marinilabilia sp.]